MNNAAEIFWRTLGAYNTDTWVYQIFMVAVGAALTLSLFAKQTNLRYALMKLYMAFVCAWIAIVYYMLYCPSRGYGEILAVFWGFMSVLWACKIFSKNPEIKVSLNIVSLVLLLGPLIYPIVSKFLGRSFPEITAPIMPCSVAVFSVGLILCFEKHINLILAMMLLHWSLLAVPKTHLYGIVEDYFLALCTVPALYMFSKNYMLQIAREKTKPSAKVLDAFLISLCVALGVFFAAMILEQFGFIKW